MAGHGESNGNEGQSGQITFPNSVNDTAADIGLILNGSAAETRAIKSPFFRGMSDAIDGVADTFDKLSGANSVFEWATGPSSNQYTIHPGTNGTLTVGEVQRRAFEAAGLTAFVDLPNTEPAPGWEFS